MTKNAQQALRHLINLYSSTRFCLICNYIRIDNGLQTELLKMRFNNLPEDKIYSLQTLQQMKTLNYLLRQFNLFKNVWF